MKNIILLFTLFFSIPALAQEETLLGTAEIEHGGYGGPVVKFTSINNNFGVLVGGRGGWIINHTFSIGLAGYGLANDVKAHAVGPFGEQYVELGYGGLDLEYIFNSNDLIHFSIHALIGGGSAGFRYSWEDENGWNYRNDTMHRDYDPFFVIEPGANIDLNVTDWFRTSAGASYRHVSGLSSKATTNSDISGVSEEVPVREFNSRTTL
ncbi:MAG: hypothetical protein HYV29_04505 [Ignavibacteriales bacterium]|nr:hypothetical protein [Ignavibacteriales bacterium]